MKGNKKQHCSKMSPQINSQGPLSDLPHSHVAAKSNMAAEMVAFEICPYPGNARSKVWEFLSSEGPKHRKT